MFPSPECTVRWLQICLKTGTRGASECVGRAEKPPRKARGNPGPAGRLLGTGRRCPSASWALQFGSQETCGRGQEGQGGDPILSRKANCSFLGRGRSQAVCADPQPCPLVLRRALQPPRAPSPLQRDVGRGCGTGRGTRGGAAGLRVPASPRRRGGLWDAHGTLSEPSRSVDRVQHLPRRVTRSVCENFVSRKLL